jgi:hypothetical protein
MIRCASEADVPGVRPASISACFTRCRHLRAQSREWHVVWPQKEADDTDRLACP